VKKNAKKGSRAKATFADDGVSGEGSFTAPNLRAPLPSPSSAANDVSDKATSEDDDVPRKATSPNDSVSVEGSFTAPDLSSRSVSPPTPAIKNRTESGTPLATTSAKASTKASAKTTTTAKPGPAPVSRPETRSQAKKRKPDSQDQAKANRWQPQKKEAQERLCQ